MKKEISEHKRKYLAYIGSNRWAKIRADILSIRGEKCELCWSKGTQVHHLTYDNLFNEEPEDLILLCNRCHLVEHGRAKPLKPGKRRRKRKPTRKQLKVQRKKELAAKEKEERKKVEALRKVYGGKKYVTRKKVD